MTGAPVPAGATAVVPVEVTNAGTETVEIRAAAKPGQHIRRAGEDVTAGVTVLSSGQLVTPAALGLAAALGLTELTVIPRQRVLVVSTGEELVAAGQPLRPGQIYESNAVMLAAAVREAGGEVVAAPMTGDDVDEFRHALDTYAGLADLIITTGGVSAGAYEVVKDSLRRSRRRVRQGRNAARHAAGRRPARSQRSRHVDSYAARQSGQRAGVVRGVRAAAAAHRDGAAVAAPTTAHRGADRRADLPARQAAVPPRRARPRDRDPSPAYGPPASHHLRWLASANCLLEIGEDVAEMASGSHVQVWDLSTGTSPVESARWPDAPNSPEMTRSPKPPG